MKSISVTDRRHIPELSHLNYFELVDPKNDHLVKPFLEMIGIDTDYPIQYVAAQHRNLQNKVVVNYMIVGEVQCNRKFLNSEWASLDDRMVAAAYQDPSLCKALCDQLNTTLDYNSFKDAIETKNGPKEQLPPNLLNKDEGVIAAQIRQLEDLLFQIRGSQFNEDGSLKTFDDYHNMTEKVETKYSKKRSRRKEK